MVNERLTGQPWSSRGMTKENARTSSRLLKKGLA